jgi:hypothetical protein
MKQKSEAAQVAALIRKELKEKFPQIKFSVKSENYSGGNSVGVSYENGVPSSEIEKITNKHVDGNFDGMTDCYNYNSNPKNLPRAKYIFVSRNISAEIKEATKKDIAARFGMNDANDEQEWMKVFNCWSDQVLWRELQKVSL